MNTSGSFGDWLRQRRKALDLTQVDLAQQVGCAPVTIRKIEAGERRPSKQISERMADVLAISRDEREAFIKFARQRPPLETTLQEDPSALSVPHNLPQQATPFIGRERELDEIAALFEDPDTRLITILAPGGMGKTRLALEAARKQLTCFVDGVYFVSLAPLTVGSDIITTIAEAMGYNFYGEIAPAQQIMNFLSERSLLLVLDNFEHLHEGTSLISDLIQTAPNLRLLITSREQLNLLAETVYPLQGLDFPAPDTDASQTTLDCDAARLFIQNARRRHSYFEVEAGDLRYLARICRLTAGMPLGIELAAGWIDILSLEEIADELQRGLDILETDLRDIPERHQSLRATLNRTWESLSADEQRVFRSLSLFRGGFRLDAALAISEANIRVIRQLTHKALVQVLPDNRYEIHELLRQFGEEKLAVSGERSLIEAKHAAFFAEFMAERRQDIRTDLQLEALRLIEADFENVRTAWLYTIIQQTWDILPKFLYSMWFYLLVRTRGQLGLELLEEAVKALRAAPASDVTELALGSVLARLGWFYNDIGFTEKATAAFEEASHILRQYDSPDDLLTALHGRQNVHIQEQWAAALSASQEGLKLARAIGDRHWEAHILIFAGLLDDVRREYISARQYADEALAAFREIGDRWGLMIAYITLVRIHLNQQQYQEASHWFRQAQPLAEAFGNIWNLSNTCVLHALIAQGQRNYEVARLELIKALKLAWNTGYKWVTPRLLTGFVQLFVDQNQIADAVAILGTLQKYPLSFKETDQVVLAMRDELQAKLEPEEFAAAWERGQEQELSVLVSKLLSEPVYVELVEG